jgi:hypothetical protein
MAELAIIRALDNILPNVLYELVIDYYGIKNSIDGNARSMYVYNDILYVLYDYHVIAYDSDLNEIRSYEILPRMLDLSVDDKYIYIISINPPIRQIKKETGEQQDFSDYMGAYITLYDNKLYIKSYNDTKINILCSISGRLLGTINTNIHNEESANFCKIMFRENELFVTWDYKFVYVKKMIIINDEYDIYVYKNKICLYTKNTLYKKDNNINIPLDVESIDKLTPNREIIVNEETITIKCIAASHDKIYVGIDHSTGSKIMVYKIQRKRKRK